MYYADGSTFSDDDGSPVDAPGYEAVCVVVPHPDVGRKILNGADFYVWHDGQWFDSDWFGAIKRVIDHPCCRVVSGVYVHDAKWKAIYQRAVTDPDFPPKGGYAPNERV